MTGKVIQLLKLLGLLCCFSVLDYCLILLRFVSGFFLINSVLLLVKFLILASIMLLVLVLLLLLTSPQCSPAFASLSHVYACTLSSTCFLLCVSCVYLLFSHVVSACFLPTPVSLLFVISLCSPVCLCSLLLDSLLPPFPFPTFQLFWGACTFFGSPSLT